MAASLFPILAVLLMNSVTTAPVAAGSTPTGDSNLISDFSSNAESRRWTVVNDGVMGGLSRGGFTITDAGTLLFSGVTSLKNNGGFSSIRMLPSELGLSGCDGISFRAKGDGRTYKFTLSTAQTTPRRGVSYWANFSTIGDEWVDVRIPFEAFVPHFRGSRLAGPELDAAKIRSIGFMIYDKRDGAFEIDIDDLQGWRQGNESTPAATDAKEPGTIPEVAKDAGTFKTLLTAVSAAGLVETLGTSGPFTVFAPTDDAFAQLPDGTVEALLKPGNQDRLVAILKNHIVAGRATARDAAAAGKAQTIGGATLAVSVRSGRLRIGNAAVIANDVAARNGVIHVIDTVLLPPEAARPVTVDARLKLLIAAIDRGAPLFNGGNPKGCVAVYEIAVLALLAWPDARLSKPVQEQLQKALSATGPRDHATAAWQLRRAMDAAINEIHGMSSDA